MKLLFLQKAISFPKLNASGSRMTGLRAKMTILIFYALTDKRPQHLNDNYFTSISCFSVSKNRGFVELAMNQCCRRRSRVCDFPFLDTQSETSTRLNANYATLNHLKYDDDPNVAAKPRIRSYTRRSIYVCDVGKKDQTK